MKNNRVAQINETRDLRAMAEENKLPPLTYSELKESFDQQQKRINELKKFPNYLSPLLQKFKEIKEKKETLNRLKKKALEIEKEYKRIEKELAEELMYCTNGKEIIEARINEKEWVVLKVVSNYDLSNKDKIVSFLKENNLSDLIIKNEVRGAKINKKGQYKDIQDIKFDEKRLHEWLNKRTKSGFSIPVFFKYSLRRELKIKKH